MRTYSEIIQLPTFEERFNYLNENGAIGDETFGFRRFLNQEFYSSSDWKRIRREVMVRDNGCDLGVPGMEITGRVYVHHINPISIDDIRYHNPDILDPEYLISMSEDTHKALHYGSLDILKQNDLIERTKDDTCPWR